MDFQRLPTIPTSEELLQTALGRARKAREQVKAGFEKRRARTTIKEVDRFITRRLLSIRRKYPNLSELREPYAELIGLELSMDDAKQALGSLQWASSRIGKIAKRYSALIGMDPDTDAKRHEGAFIGRVASLLERIDTALENVRILRRILVELPVLRDDALLVAIAGFPNVGKSTLLAKMTSAKPEVASYAFTTKGLNLGLLESSGIVFQLIDTPGTLNRDHANTIERRAHLIIEHADLIIYVFDPTESYPLDEQLILYEHMKDPIRYVSKTDISEVPERVSALGPYETTPHGIAAALVAQARIRAAQNHTGSPSPTA